MVVARPTAVRARSSEREAVEPAELFSAHYPRLAGWVRRLVDDDDTAHEIAAEAFTRLLARWSRVDDPRGYLYVIATNLVRDHWRHAQRERRALARSALGRTEVTEAADPSVRALVEALPDTLRAVVLLHYYADYSVADVAKLLGRPVGTVKSDLYNARARLLAALEGQR